jgi:hypothetical protein
VAIAVVAEACKQTKRGKRGQPLDQDAVLMFASGDRGRRLEVLRYRLGDPALADPVTVVGVIGASNFCS